IALGRDRRAAGAVVDQRDLAEVVARPELAVLAAPHGDRRLAALDHEEAGAALALLGDGAAGVEGPLLERARKPLEIAALEVGEQGDALEQLDRRLRHCAG